MSNGLQFTNFAAGTLVSAITNLTTVLQLSASDLAEFPLVATGELATAVLHDGVQADEVVHIISNDGVTLTVSRGEESTAALSWNSGTLLIHTATAEAYNAFSNVADDDVTPSNPVYLSGDHDILEVIHNTTYYVSPVAEGVVEIQLPLLTADDIGKRLTFHLQAAGTYNILSDPTQTIEGETSLSNNQPNTSITLEVGQTPDLVSYTWYNVQDSRKGLASASLLLIPLDEASAVATYWAMTTDVEDPRIAATPVMLSAPVLVADTVVGQWASDDNLIIGEVPQGVQTVSVQAKLNSAADKPISLMFRLYVRDSGGTEVEVNSGSDPHIVSSLAYDNFLFTIVAPTFSMLATDRLVYRAYATPIGGTSNLDSTVEGSPITAKAQIGTGAGTVPVDHADLLGVLGNGEYHLDSDEQAMVEALEIAGGYEEGTLSLTAAFATPGDSSYTGTITGKYTRIGNKVYGYLDMDITWNAYTTASGLLSLSGLPYASVKGGGVITQKSSAVDLTAGFTQMSIQIVGTALYFRRHAQVATTGYMTTNSFAAGSNSVIQAEFSYEVA